MSTSDPSPAAANGLPTAQVRTLASFVLFVHLFMVACGIASRAATSNAAANLRRVPGLGPYLQFLYMNLSYQYQLTYAEAPDFDHWLDLELRTPNGDVQRVTLPEPGMQPGQRRRHFQHLAREVSRLAEDPDLAGLLPRSIAARICLETGATSGTIRCREPDIAKLDRELSNSPPRAKSVEEFRAEYYRDGYEARIVMAGGQVQVVRVEAAGESAPAAKGRRQTDSGAARRP